MADDINSPGEDVEVSDEGQTFANLMLEVKGGSEDAVRRLLDTYGSHIYRTVRRRLARRMRSKFDSEDFCQAVWASFFARRDEITRFNEPKDLIAFLNTVAGNKVIEECRRRLISKKYNLNRERSSESTAIAVEYAAKTRGPTPSQVVGAREQVDRLLEGQPPVYRRIVELRAAGSTFDEIARETGLNERSVRRVMKRLAQQLEE